MKKIILFFISIFVFNTKINAQTNSSKASQQLVDLALSNALEMTFASNNSVNGTTVSLPFGTVNDYANGVESNPQTINIKSNKNFKITVKTSSSKFTVTIGGSTTTSTMPASVLGLLVSSNNTGGTLGSGFSATTYKSLSSSSVALINNALHGGDKSLIVKYKATPGFTYAAGTYNISVVYTATQQ